MRSPVPFYKSVGGYIYCVMWRGRWHVVPFITSGHGEGQRAMREWFDWHAERGIQVTRVGTFRKMEEVVARSGNTPAALLANLPHFRGC